MGMKELMKDIALANAVTRRFESIGYSMDDALRVATIAILTGKPILVTRTKSDTTNSMETNNNTNTNSRFK